MSNCFYTKFEVKKQMTNKTFNVVFEYTREAKGYEGVITWTSFKDEANFKEWYTPDIEKRQRVLAKGVTRDEAVEFVKQTPAACYVAACLEDATDPDTGEVDKEILEMRLKTVALSRALKK